MFAFLKFVFLCLLAVAAGVAAVTIPYEGRTVAEHVRELVEQNLDSEPAAAPKKQAPTRTVAKPAARPSRDRPPADDHTEEDRKALDKLLGERVR